MSPGPGPFGGWANAVGQIADGLAAGPADEGWATPDELDRDGPRFPDRWALGYYEVQGYVVNGWPIVVDLDTRQGARAWLEVRAQDTRAPIRILLAGDGRRTQVVHLPNDGPFSSLHVAKFIVRSTIVGPDGRWAYAPLGMFGIGAGPRAVGSMTIEVTEFDPAQASGPDQVRYAVMAHRLFDRSAIEVLRLPKTGDRLELIKDARQFPFAPGLHSGDWRTMGVKPSPATGDYLLQVRAWLVGAAGDERDWTGAYAPNRVQIR